MWRLTWITFKPPQYRTNYEWIQFKKQNISAGIDHQLHDGLDNEGERGHGHEDWDEGAEELHEGDGGGVPQQDHLRLPECDEAALYNPLDNQRTGTKGIFSKKNLAWLRNRCGLGTRTTVGRWPGRSATPSRRPSPCPSPRWSALICRWDCDKVWSWNLFQGDILGVRKCNKPAHGRYNGLLSGEGLEIVELIKSN